MGQKISTKVILAVAYCDSDIVIIDDYCLLLDRRWPKTILISYNNFIR